MEQIILSFQDLTPWLAESAGPSSARIGPSSVVTQICRAAVMIWMLGPTITRSVYL